MYLLQCYHRAHGWSLLQPFLLLHLVQHEVLFMAESVLHMTCMCLTLCPLTSGSASHAIFCRSAALREADGRRQRKAAVVAKSKDYQTYSRDSCQSQPRPGENLSFLTEANFSCLATKPSLPCPLQTVSRAPTTIQQTKLQAACLTIYTLNRGQDELGSSCSEQRPTDYGRHHV